MLPLKNRLYKEPEINRLLKEGQTFFLPELIIKYTFKYFYYNMIYSFKDKKNTINISTIQKQDFVKFDFLYT